MQVTQFVILKQPISLDDKGFFHVTLETSERLKAQSILALKKKAEATKRVNTFPVLIWSQYGQVEGKPAFEISTVIGTMKSRYYPPDFRLACGRNAGSSVVLDTPENRNILRKVHKIRARGEKLDRAIEVLKEGLVKRSSTVPTVDVAEETA